jgi:hypothetical protein
MEKLSVNLNVEVYVEEDGIYGIYLSDEMGGSGISVKGDSPEDAANQIAPYIADYFYPREDEETEEDIESEFSEVY